MTVIKQFSLNVSGLNNAIKRKRIAKCVKELQAHLIFVCVQETHLRIQKEKYLNNLFKGQLFHALAVNN